MTLQQALDLWNEAAARCGWPLVRRLTSERERKLRGLIRSGLEDWKEALGKAEASDFLCGRAEKTSHHGWRFTFDFFVTESRFTRILEGNYDNKSGGSSADYKSPERALWEARLRDLKAGGKWYAHIWGPPPGEAGCKVPAALLNGKMGLH